MKTVTWRFLILVIGCIVADASVPKEAVADVTSLSSAVKSLIKNIRPKPNLKQLDEFLLGTPKVSEALSLEETSKILSNYIFEQWQIQADTSYLSRENKDNILPDSVLALKRGHCLGLATLYLLSAERAGVQAALVRAPDHVFVRLCKLDRCINIEPLKRGQIVTDSFYVQNLTIPKLALERNIYLKSLTDRNEVLASIYLGLGYVVSQSRQNDLAVHFYKLAIEKSPEFADPYSNLASIEAAAGDMKSASLHLKRALELNPVHYATLINFGSLSYQQGDIEQAISFFDRALESNPLSIQAYRKRAFAYTLKKKDELALVDLEKILIIEPKYCDVIEERDLLSLKLKKKPIISKAPSLSELKQKHLCLTLPR